MSKAITTQATNLAQPSFDVANPDTLRLTAIVMELAKTKKQGFNFNASVLFTKVCKQVKSLAGMSDSSRLPDNVAKEVHAIIAALPDARIKALQNEQGFKWLSESGTRINLDMRNLRVTRRKSLTMEAITSLDMQIKDITWQISQWNVAITKLNATPVDTAEKRSEVEDKIASLEEKIKRASRLKAILQAERKAQSEVAKETEASNKEESK